jgi:hypothetical protein
MKALPEKRLQSLEQRHAREQRVHLVWVEPDDSEAVIEEKCNRLIAEGRAGPHDRFVLTGWKG